MTVSELIDELRKHPLNARVVLDGGWGGLIDLEHVIGTEILLDRYDHKESPVWGPHDVASEDSIGLGVLAVYFPREWREE